MNYQGYVITETENNKTFPIEVTEKNAPLFLRRFKTVAAAKAAISVSYKKGYFA